MKKYIRLARRLPGSFSSYYPTTLVEQLYSKNKLYYSDQLEYENLFKRVFKVAPFYFDNVFLVDKNTQETIEGPTLNTSSYSDFTDCLIHYFNIPISSALQARIDKAKSLDIY